MKAPQLREVGMHMGVRHPGPENGLCDGPVRVSYSQIAQLPEMSHDRKPFKLRMLLMFRQ